MGDLEYNNYRSLGERTSFRFIGFCVAKSLWPLVSRCLSRQLSNTRAGGGGEGLRWTGQGAENKNSDLWLQTIDC